MLNHLPYHALIVDQVQDVFSNFKFAVLREIFLQIPEPASVEDANENGSDEVDDHDGDDGKDLGMKCNRCISSGGLKEMIGHKCVEGRLGAKGEPGGLCPHFYICHV